MSHEALEHYGITPNGQPFDLTQRGEMQMTFMAGNEVCSVKLQAVTDPAVADTVIFRQDGFWPDGSPIPELKSDDEILMEIQEAVKSRHWFQSTEFIDRQPFNQWHIKTNQADIELFNYAEGLIMDNRHAMVIASTVARFDSHFPGAADKVKTIAVTDQLPDSVAGNPIKYPTHGCALTDKNHINLTPHATSFEPYRRSQLPIATLPAVVAHELAHFWGPAKLHKEWESAGYSWQLVADKLGVREWVADRPEGSVTDYARRHIDEDICESFAAYIYAPKLLEDHAKEKYEIIAARDIGEQEYSYSVQQAELPQTPQIPPEFTYFIDETIFFDES